MKPGICVPHKLKVGNLNGIYLLTQTQNTEFNTRQKELI